ncbi:hypothetical protein TOPH_05891 [Tolypocladium ophioglossoides CBS 100239]|uniref:Uncharacterized protein n=1 Tax=Tolypocladium ophioglossoides (strain CBS 100239) TaxID=1163406 RepID=A0A0L0N5U4_TOLOC|nr:hypothetical protein TOPH_05891 [Tolypocladium ophioglossoides CBS 100239]
MQRYEVLRMANSNRNTSYRLRVCVYGYCPLRPETREWERIMMIAGMVEVARQVLPIKAIFPQLAPAPIHRKRSLAILYNAVLHSSGSLCPICISHRTRSNRPCCEATASPACSCMKVLPTNSSGLCTTTRLRDTNNAAYTTRTRRRFATSSVQYKVTMEAGRRRTRSTPPPSPSREHGC